VHKRKLDLGCSNRDFSLDVKPQPTLQLTPVNDSPDVTASGTYTVAMIDADVVGADQTGGQTRHWLVNDVKATGKFIPTLSTIKI
jgi:phosphatidylethanolamine-binding protein (PEBP) family uncharacterized protein